MAFKKKLSGHRKALPYVFWTGRLSVPVYPVFWMWMAVGVVIHGRVWRRNASGYTDNSPSLLIIFKVFLLHQTWNKFWK